MRAFAINNIQDYDKIYLYLLHQGAWWYPQEDVYTYKGEMYKIFFMSESSPHLSYLLMKYNLVDFTDILAKHYGRSLYFKV